MSSVGILALPRVQVRVRPMTREAARLTLEEFVAERGPALLRLAWLLSGDRDTAHDIVQESLVRVLPRWGRITKRGQDPEPYLRTVIRSVWVDGWRRASRTPVDPVAEPPDPARPDPALDALADQVALERALTELAPGHRAVVVLRFYEDLTEVQTAAVLGCSVSTVKSQTRDALRRLRLLSPGLLPDSADRAGGPS
jgi:RNA polymerase sigma-70 factor (sigma-E family)